MVENKKLDRSLVMEDIAAVHPSPTEELLHLREQLKTEKEQKVEQEINHVVYCMHTHVHTLHTYTHTHYTHTHYTHTLHTYTLHILHAHTTYMRTHTHYTHTRVHTHTQHTHVTFKYSNRTYIQIHTLSTFKETKYCIRLLNIVRIINSFIKPFMLQEWVSFHSVLKTTNLKPHY